MPVLCRLRSALKWGCPKNVSGASEILFLFALSINMITQPPNQVVEDISMWNSGMTLMIHCHGQVSLEMAWKEKTGDFQIKFESGIW